MRRLDDVVIHADDLGELGHVRRLPTDRIRLARITLSVCRATFPTGIIRPVMDSSDPRLTPSWHARRTPDKPAIIVGSTGEVTTYAELDDRSTRFAHVLRARGLIEGSHAAVLMENN